MVFVFPIPGVGAFGNHIFSDPSLILRFGGNRGTKLGLRLSTPVPLPLGLFILVPSFAIDFIDGHRNYWFGLGLQF